MSTTLTSKLQNLNLEEETDELYPPNSTMAMTHAFKLHQVHLEETKDEVIGPPDGHLTFGYMMKYEPFDTLPIGYFPWKEVDHYPPTFDYGIPVTVEEIKDYARREIFAGGPVPDDYRRVLFGVFEKLDNEFGLDPALGFFIGTPYSKTQGLVILKFIDNYFCPFSVEKVNLIVDGIKKAFGKAPQWFLSGTNKKFKDHYNVPDWKLDRYDAHRRKLLNF
ncbi:hypothetical protein E1B28_007045 [Marasmius oreades]|uniref:Uncharacterized protein n=1 Tax=Marasmius oreades TaxID=181124 RepID=A0A9P7UTD3_9AGAR|nr:uncharacterized protein E1B28_007045 [Marasmius oreades]KAG7093363.1 hypothetical protein E1B28_007045 [Marasmius oreades]